MSRLSAASWEVAGPGRDDWERMAELVAVYADMRLGGTDASVITLAERLGTTRIATLNHRHFRIVRPRHAGRRDVREDMKTRAGVRTVMIPDIAMPAVSRLYDRGTQGRDRSGGQLYTRLINGDRGGYLGYAMWRRYLRLAHGYTAAHPDGTVRIHRPRTAARLRLAAHRVRGVRHAGRPPDGT
jgi:hypothetical protein